MASSKLAPARVPTCHMLFAMIRDGDDEEKWFLGRSHNFLADKNIYIGLLLKLRIFVPREILMNVNVYSLFVK